MLSKYFRCMSRGERKHCQITSCLISPRKGFFIHGQADDLQIHDDCLIREHPSSLINSFTIHQDRGSLDVEHWNWVHLAGFDSSSAFSIKSSTAVTLPKHRRMFIISMLILILLSVLPKTLPGGRGRVSSTIASSGRSVGLRLSYPHPRTLWWSCCSGRTSATVWDISMECRSVSSAMASCIARLIMWLHRTVWSAGYEPCCSGWTFQW